ncbi:MAG: carbamoyltransferase HypF [Armatimonadota bacterium]|nr:carbamoyltransferase HypF [Armatimonadota bacterium]MDW8143601.1 carbamoyltransferase HypF [Armatimonadota bacterium]
MKKRWQIKVTGIVQGVGFRPFVWRLANRLGLTGFVFNNPQGVVIEAEGEGEALEAFVRFLKTDAPPLAVVESVSWQEIPTNSDAEFKIVESHRDAERIVLISPDVATCDDCLRELFDPNDRRYLYPFLNCTNCGPRFTIIVDVPYDRERTTMAVFPMCPDCEREYHDPNDRRFHAQPTACPRCGPKVRLIARNSNGEWEEICQDNEAIKETARRLLEGQIVAIKGLGGYHLACDAANENAVKRLRQSKHREFKPFALMTPDLKTAHQLAFISPEEEALLTSWRRPIVLMRRRPDANVAESVAPKHRDLGIMLPYTPLHHLLMSEVKRTLVMTSGNLSDEPIAYKDDDAFQRLGKMVDAFLVHNREIHIRCDDSVTRVVKGQELLIRRSRGYAPQPVLLPFETPVPLLAVGAMLKNTFALCRNRYAFISHHIGDLDNYAAFKAFVEGVEHFKRLFAIEPQAVVYDLHPDYPSTRYALDYADERDLPSIGVQHHHAHVAAVMAEYGLKGPVIGVAYDGTGYGTDGTIWGGEILLATYESFERAAHLEYVPMPGGEKAVRESWRMAASWLMRSFGNEGKELSFGIAERVGLDRWNQVWKLLHSDLPQPQTSSIGRLFDAVASLLGICDIGAYEGHPAIWLEMVAAQWTRKIGGWWSGTGDWSEDFWQPPFAFELTDAAPIVMKATPVISGIVEALKRNLPVEQIAAQFHASVADATLRACIKIRERTGVNKVVLSGGVMQNVLLLGWLIELLNREGFKVFVPTKLPPNDGGICFGQGAIAARLLRDNSND